MRYVRIPIGVMSPGKLKGLLGSINADAEIWFSQPMFQKSPKDDRAYHLLQQDRRPELFIYNDHDNSQNLIASYPVIAPQTIIALTPGSLTFTIDDDPSLQTSKLTFDLLDAAGKQTYADKSSTQIGSPFLYCDSNAWPPRNDIRWLSCYAYTKPYPPQHNTNMANVVLERRVTLPSRGRVLTLG